ncbi:MAG: hypothetical protein ACJAR2_003014 [Ilumatobacter sp.]|jgi:hypothetical protein
MSSSACSAFCPLVPLALTEQPALLRLIELHESAVGPATERAGPYEGDKVDVGTEVDDSNI